MHINSSRAIPQLDIDPSRQPEFRHRSGWAFAIDALAPLHNPGGVLLDSFIERTFSWAESNELARGRIPYEVPWVGFVHNPPTIPDWHDTRSSPRAILNRDSFRQSLPYCRGLLTLSEHLGRWLSTRVPVPVCSLIHPTEIPEVRFSPDRFAQEKNPVVVQVGWWLRRVQSIFQLQSGRFRKVLLAVENRYLEEMLRRQKFELSEVERNSVTLVPFLSNDDYDRLLSRSVVFCHLFDSSANNVIVECIARNTPILVNRLPAVEEYLGRDYPLFFESLHEASAILADSHRILEAYHHLSTLPKDQFSQSTFRESLVRSRIYQGLSLKSLPVALQHTVRFESSRQFTLVLGRSACGNVFVERAEFHPASADMNASLNRDLQGLLCGLSLAAVRQLSRDDFCRSFGNHSSIYATQAYEAMARSLEQI
ncbi:MAG: glycosyltransferase family 1 protein [Planctomycetota bacterium]